MIQIKKIGVLSLAKFQGAMMGVMGIIAGAIYSIGGLIIDTLVTFDVVRSTETPGLSHGTLLALGALIIMPLLFAAYGFVIGAVSALIYNLVAKWVGGIEMEIEK